MNPINEENLSTAIQVGTAVCNELGICCSQRGRIIFHIYKKLEELKSVKPITAEGEKAPEPGQIGAEKPKDLQI